MKKPTVFGDMLRTYRAIMGWDLRTLAERIGVSASTLMRVEHGRGIDPESWLTFQEWLWSESTIKRTR